MLTLHISNSNTNADLARTKDERSFSVFENCNYTVAQILSQYLNWNMEFLITTRNFSFLNTDILL
jgi:hypothetical protein